MNREEISKALDELEESYISKAAMYRKPKKKPWRMAAAIAAVICLWVGAMMGKGKEGPVTVTEQKIENSKENPTLEKKVDESPVSIVVNPIDEIAQADIDAEITDYMNKSQKELEVAKQGFQKFIGIHYSQILSKLPKGYNVTQFYSLATPNKKEKRYDIHDYTLGLSKGKGTMTISMSSLGEPIRDCIFIGREREPSLIYGTQVTIYSFEKNYYATFQLDGVHYDIESQGSSLHEFEEVLVGLIKSR